jgi:hypothetical protein
MIQSVSYYSATPELREAQMQDFYKVIRGLGYINTGSTVNNTTYGVEPLVIEGVTIHVTKESKYFLLSTERYSRSKRDGGKSVKIPIGTLINAPRIKRAVKEIIQIQKDRVAAEAARQAKKNECKEVAEALNTWLVSTGRGKANASWSDTINVNIDTKTEGDIDFTVDYKTLAVNGVEAKTSIPRLSSYGCNTRKEMEDAMAKIQTELKRLEIAENVMAVYILTLEMAETK